MNVRRSAAMAVAVAAILVSGPAGLAASGDRPFRATVTGHANPTPTADPCVLTNDESGTGTAVHMGSMSWTSSETVNFCSNPAGADVAGEFVMTAANGDQVKGRYVTLAHPDFGAGVITFSGTFEITGGTGRFAGASGEGELSGQGSLLEPFDVFASFTGSIS